MILICLFSSVLSGIPKALCAQDPAGNHRPNTNAVIKFYQEHISGIDGDRCPMYPSCSRYGAQAMQKHGVGLGWIMACDRLLRCGRDEVRLSAHVRVNGRELTFDPVSANDFWWFSPKPSAIESNLNDQSAILITADMQFNYAMTLFEQKDFTAAQVEFKRFIHFFPQDPRRDRADYTAGAALFHSGQYYEAAKRFDTIIRQSKDTDSPWARQSCFMQSQAFEAMGNPGYAQVVLQNYLKLTRDTAAKDRIYLELARLHIQNTVTPGKNELDYARKNLMLISPEKQREYKVAKQVEAIDNAVNAPAKSPALAGILAIIPGGGMLYCERYKDAFVSFCFNTGLIWAAYTAFDHDNPALGGVITFVETGFYSGNIYGSITAAHKHNKAAQIKILEKTFNFEPGFDPVNKSFILKLKHDF